MALTKGLFRYFKKLGRDPVPEVVSRRCISLCFSFHVVTKSSNSSGRRPIRFTRLNCTVVSWVTELLFHPPCNQIKIVQLMLTYADT